MQKRMDLAPQDLELILTLYRKKTLTAAAADLGIEQSTLSRQLTAIEEKLKGSLFLRHRKGLTPSPMVSSLIPWAEKMEVILRNANQAASTQADDVTGEVHISCPDAIADLLLAPHIHELQKKHSGLRLKITGSEALMDLDRLDCDIAIRIGPKPKGDAIVVKLAESPIMAFGRPEFCPPSGEIPLHHLPIFHRSEVLSPDSKLIRGLAPERIVLAANRMTTAILAAKSGGGVVFLPEAFGNAIPEFVQIPIKDWPAPKVPIYLAAPRTVRRLRHVDAVWSWIRKVFEG